MVTSQVLDGYKHFIVATLKWKNKWALFGLANNPMDKKSKIWR